MIKYIYSTAPNRIRDFIIKVDDHIDDKEDNEN